MSNPKATRKKKGEAPAKTRTPKRTGRPTLYPDAQRYQDGREARLQVIMTPAIADAVTYMRKEAPLLVRSNSHAGEILVLAGLGIELPRDLRALVSRAGSPVIREDAAKARANAEAAAAAKQATARAAD